MTDLVVTPRAHAGALVARNWYDAQSEGLGDRFLDELFAAFDRARENPESYQMVVGEARRVLLKRFPYAAFFLTEEDQVVVLAVLHQAEDPAKWPPR